MTILATFYGFNLSLQPLKWKCIPGQLKKTQEQFYCQAAYFQFSNQWLQKMVQTNSSPELEPIHSTDKTFSLIKRFISINQNYNNLS